MIENDFMLVLKKIHKNDFHKCMLWLLIMMKRVDYADPLKKIHLTLFSSSVDWQLVLLVVTGKKVRTTREN